VSSGRCVVAVEEADTIAPLATVGVEGSLYVSLTTDAPSCPGGDDGVERVGGLESAGRRDLLFDLVEQGLDARFDIVPDRPDRVEVLSVGIFERPVSDIDV